MTPNEQPEVHVNAEDARAGATPHVTRWVLGISLTLAIIAMSAVWIIPSLSQGDQLQDDQTESETMQTEAN